VSGRDKRDLNTSAATRKVATQTVRDRAIAEAGNTGEGGPDGTAPPVVVRPEDQDPNAFQRRLPSLPNSRSNTLNSLPPAGGGESKEQVLADAENINYSDGDFNNEDDNIYEAARTNSDRQAIPGFVEALTQEELEALQLQQFQKQQQEANRQMYVQQQQLLEVAQAIASKPGSRSTTTVLEIGMGGSSDKPQSSKEKSLRRKILELEFALQQEKISNQNFDYHYRKLWNRANAQGEELQRYQHQNQSLMHELEAVNAQLADAKKLSEVRGKKLKELKVDTADVDQEANEEEPLDMLGESDILLTADVIQMVDVLNVEVRRVAAVLGKELQKTKFEEGTARSCRSLRKLD